MASSARPHVKRRPQRGLGDGDVEQLVVQVVNEHVRPGEEPQLLLRLLLQAFEILLMRVAQVGEDAHGGADDGFEPFHFAGTGDARLEDGELGVRVQPPHGEGTPVCEL